MSGSILSLKGELNSIVKEYLEFSELHNVASLFEKECQRTGKPIQDNPTVIKKDEKLLKIQGKMLESFDEYQRLDFFNDWDANISEEVRENNLVCQKLEFQLQLHFAVAPLRKMDQWVSEESTEAIFFFRYYLETKGSTLSHVPEFLPFYALPYVYDPQNHPSFKELFQETWIIELRRKLESFLYECLKETLSEPHQPQLSRLYTNNTAALEESNQVLRACEKSLEDAEKLYALKSKQLVKFQEDHQKLMLVAADLVLAVEAAVKGDLLDIDILLNQASARFPELFNHQTKSERVENPDLALISNKSTIAQKMKETLHKQSVELSDFSFADLDFEKIKRDLVILEPKSKALLLQALRWRLTKSTSDEHKEIILSSYITNDILGSQRPSQFKILNLMKTTETFVLQSLARFLNALASFQKGRTYLSQYRELLSSLLDFILQSNSSETITKNMILGVLQKLSLRRVLQLCMIDKGMIEWLLSNLKDPTQLDSYFLEYSAALLMNLCLTNEGRNKCKSILDDVLKLFTSLLEFNKVEILPYVNGGLFSLFGDNEIKSKAKEMGLDETLKLLKTNMSAENSRQVDFVLKKLLSEENQIASPNDQEIEDEDDDEIDIEPEIDLNDPVIDGLTDITGEKLLSSNYSKVKANTTNASNGLNKKANPGEKVRLLSKQPKLDALATEMVRRLTGEPSKVLIVAESLATPRTYDVNRVHAQEYAIAFSSRPKIPRSPEPDEFDEDQEELSFEENSSPASNRAKFECSLPSSPESSFITSKLLIQQ